MARKKDPPNGEGKVVSITLQLVQKKLDAVRRQCEAMHLRGMERMWASEDAIASIRELTEEDFAKDREQMSELPAEQARLGLATVRSIQALHLCFRGDEAAGLSLWDEIL